MRFRVLGRNKASGAILKALGATPILAFVLTLPICGPWTAGGPMTLPEARKTGFPE